MILDINDENVETIGDNLLIDCRENEEFNAGHLKGAINIPLSKLEEIGVSLIENQNELIYVYCRSGKRAANFCETLKVNGICCVNLGGVLYYEGNLAK